MGRSERGDGPVSSLVRLTLLVACVVAATLTVRAGVAIIAPSKHASATHSTASVTSTTSTTVDPRACFAEAEPLPQLTPVGQGIREIPADFPVPTSPSSVTLDGRYDGAWHSATLEFPLPVHVVLATYNTLGIEVVCTDVDGAEVALPSHPDLVPIQVSPKDGGTEMVIFTYPDEQTPEERAYQAVVQGNSTPTGPSECMADNCFHDSREDQLHSNGDEGSYEEERSCVGDCYDEDGDGRTYDDVDGDGDGHYESR